MGCDDSVDCDAEPVVEPVVESVGVVMEIKIDAQTLKSPAGIVMAVVVSLGGIGYLYSRRASLINQGTPQVEEYLGTKLSSNYISSLNGQLPD